ncbi:unnamed protein product [Soboliphyme baturini]|uniref:WD_REPEATS_REGION domain-containing protein n=1 Tax=Soboliphyme baturini TaxID=241478 RepID=A0A183IL40_9BILA|nr:unnamed protein product [Soboliphyme baturini]
MEDKRIIVQLKDEDGVYLGVSMDVPIDITKQQLQQICNSLMQLEEPVPCSFLLNEKEIVDSLSDTIDLDSVNTEKILEITYQPLALFRVQAVTRCSSSLPGHAEPVISAQFSPDSKHLASGSGDTTVRLWDLNTETPEFTCKGHHNWVLCICWSPDSQKLASACKNGHVIIWDPLKGTQIGRVLTGHKSWITCLAWQPLHCATEVRLLASSSKDCDIRIWDIVLGRTVRVLAGHSACVTCIKWSGEDLIFSSSEDRTIKVWRADDGTLCRTLEGHGHWVNTMSLNTDYVLKTGGFDPLHQPYPEDVNELREVALRRYQEVKRADPERLVSGSDDFTLCLWQPSINKKPIQRMTGHQQLINHVQFSPDGRIIASASFDKSVKLWCGKTGKFITTLRGHVQAVYQISWSSDSRLLVSGSADSTLKLWDMRTKKLAIDLPGHADEVS